VDGRDESNSTALHWACANNRSQVVQLLLERGADPLTRNSRGETPLHVARTVGATACMPLLAKALTEAAPVAAAPDPQPIAVLPPVPNDAMLRAVFNGILSDLRSALLAGADPNLVVTSDLATVLHLACAFGQAPLVRLLLERGCFRAPRMAGEVTPLFLACGEGHLHVVRAMLEQEDAGLYALNKDGQDCLHVAAINGRAEVVAQLLKHRDGRAVFERDK
jgi:ankyrin repeat protein